MSLPALITEIIVITELVSVGWALWVRRITWGLRWESATTLAIALLGVAVTLNLTSVGDLLGRGMQAITGCSNVNYPLGYLCVLLAAACIVFIALDRLYEDDGELCAEFKRTVEWPVVGAGVALFVSFRMARMGHAEVFHAAEGIWADLFWVTFAATLVYLLGYACRALLIVRQDRRQRLIADLCFVSCVGGIAGAVARLVEALVPAVRLVDAAQLAIVVPVGVWVVAFSLASAWSWRCKMRPFAQLLRASHG